MQQEEVKTNLLSSAQWLRILTMIGFLVAVWALGFVLAAIVVVQTVIVLVTGTVNRNLQRFGGQASAYLGEIADFMVYATEHRPFPFAPFPEPRIIVMPEPVTVRPMDVTPASATTTVHTPEPPPAPTTAPPFTAPASDAPSAPPPTSTPVYTPPESPTDTTTAPAWDETLPPPEPPPTPEDGDSDFPSGDGRPGQG